MEYKEPFKKDNRGLWCLDSKDVKIHDLYVKQMSGSYRDRAHFFSIDGIDDYVVKDCTMHPLVFNRYQNLQLLRRLIEKQDKINSVDFPVAYYKSFNILKGIVIPFYKGSTSLQEITCLHKFEELRDFYDHESDDVDNLISLLLDILQLISDMYDIGTYYLDIHTGNFLVYNNSIKVIDFEPGHVYFRDREWNLKIMLNNYAILVERIRKRFGFKEIFFHSGIDFYNTEYNVKELKKRLER